MTQTTIYMSTSTKNLLPKTSEPLITHEGLVLLTANADC